MLPLAMSDEARIFLAGLAAGLVIGGYVSAWWVQKLQKWKSK